MIAPVQESLNGVAVGGSCVWVSQVAENELVPSELSCRASIADDRGWLDWPSGRWNWQRIARQHHRLVGQYGVDCGSRRFVVHALQLLVATTIAIAQTLPAEILRR